MRHQRVEIAVVIEIGQGNAPRVLPRVPADVPGNVDETIVAIQVDPIRLVRKDAAARQIRPAIGTAAS